MGQLVCSLGVCVYGADVRDWVLIDMFAPFLGEQKEEYLMPIASYRVKYWSSEPPSCLCHTPLGLTAPSAWIRCHYFFASRGNFLIWSSLFRVVWLCLNNKNSLFCHFNIINKFPEETKTNNEFILLTSIACVTAVWYSLCATELHCSPKAIKKTLKSKTMHLGDIGLWLQWVRSV